MLNPWLVLAYEAGREREEASMKLTIALAGNPNAGKTTLFNALTGANQFVGNWPGVTVEKKEGKLKKHPEVTITDLPGIYSLSPYTLEEVVARNYLIGERPNAILNIIDGTNLERNLYLTTQLVELGIPVVVAINMMDVVKKNGDKINTDELARELGCKVVEISALKGTGVMEAAEVAVDAAQHGKTIPQHNFSGRRGARAGPYRGGAAARSARGAAALVSLLKIFERDQKVLEQLKSASAAICLHVEADIQACREGAGRRRREHHHQRALRLHRLHHPRAAYKKKSASKLTTSDKIDKVVTNRWLALPIFAVIMFIVYYVSVTTVGGWATGWANDGVFGDGWHLLGIGSSAYNDANDEYTDASNIVNGYIEDQGLDDVADAIDSESDEFDADAAAAALTAMAADVKSDYKFTYELQDEENLSVSDETATGADVLESIDVMLADGCEAPNPADYGVYVPSIPALIESGLSAVNCADWLSGLILDGIVAGVGAVLGFVPQMLVLFIFLAFLEACGYMARIAFIMDRIFRKFGLSGKSFIPMLIGTGCGVPGIMASRTIENDRDRQHDDYDHHLHPLRRQAALSSP